MKMIPVKKYRLAIDQKEVVSNLGRIHEIKYFQGFLRISNQYWMMEVS